MIRVACKPAGRHTFSLLTSLKHYCAYRKCTVRAASMGSDSSYLLIGLSFLLTDQMAGTLFLVLSRAADVGFDWQVQV